MMASDETSAYNRNGWNRDSDCHPYRVRSTHCGLAALLAERVEQRWSKRALQAERLNQTVCFACKRGCLHVPAATNNCSTVCR
jgi:hypothetical protein